MSVNILETLKELNAGVDSEIFTTSTVTVSFSMHGCSFKTVVLHQSKSTTVPYLLDKCAVFIEFCLKV